MSSFHQLSQNLGVIPAFPSLPRSTSPPQTILLPPQNVSKSPGLVTLASGRHLFGLGSAGTPQRPSATTALIPVQPFPTQRPWRALLSISPMHVIFLLKNSPQFPLHPWESLGLKSGPTRPSRSSPLPFLSSVPQSPHPLGSGPLAPGHCSNEPGVPPRRASAVVLRLLSGAPFLGISWLTPPLPAPAGMSLSLTPCF